MSKIYQKNISFNIIPAKGKFGGFTLIELLVVVLIIGILAAIALPQYQIAVAKSRYTQLIVGATAIKRANQLYYMANNVYSRDLRELDLTLSGCEISQDGRSCTLTKNGTVLAVCTLDDSNSAADAAWQAQAYCSGDDLFYYLHMNDDERFCFARQTNKIANSVCKSLGGRYMGENNGLSRYVLP